ncbi:M48 family metallopeptidase [Paraherbaspirillum soli]|uniref:M48 family metallopeptidase n=1 Tax=Paraherbaspirillum soli TaxID=631222 RepID=A0ABW0M5P5_9BURK
MTFFEQQDRARQHTKKLVFLFALAVIAIVAAVNLVVALAWTVNSGTHHGVAHHYPKGFFAINTLITLMVIGGGTLYQMFQLREGGDAVAEMAGGRLVERDSTDLLERRLLNVVDEMALASGVACPKVYLLDDEDAINAFAAGYRPDQAVVAVTRGTLTRLTRDELQGVVGHEFSHILNGDMRLNIQLIGVLFGIQMIASCGQYLMDSDTRTSRRDRDSKGNSDSLLWFAVGVGLFAIGYIGIFFGRLIKAAVSRQREFLADASSHQFTRNPDGIGGALRKIGGLSRGKKLGSQINHPNAEQLSHLFLGTARPSFLSGWFATHPPLEERLKRIYGRNMPPLDAPELEQPAAEPGERQADLPFTAAGFAGAGGAAAFSAPTPVAAVGAGTPSLEFGNSHGTAAKLPSQLDGAARDPVAACAVVYALLLADGAKRDPQLALLNAEVPQQSALTVLLAESIAQLPRSARLPLVDLATPALRQLTPAGREQLLARVERLIAAGGRITLAEFVLQTILLHRLAPQGGRPTPITFDQLSDLSDDVAVLLSLVVHVAVPAATPNAYEARAAAFQRGTAACPGLGLSATHFRSGAELGFPRLRQALENANQLAPLAKPQLVKALLAVTDGACNTSALSIASADLLRALCAGLEAPLPPLVAAAYSDYPWQFDN